jgi:hypothetical protein
MDGGRTVPVYHFPLFNTLSSSSSRFSGKTVRFTCYRKLKREDASAKGPDYGFGTGTGHATSLEQY